MPEETIESDLVESKMLIDNVDIGYCRYGNGPNYVLCICGAVGSYKKDWPLTLLKHFDYESLTIVCFDPPGYGTSRPPERKQEGLDMVPFTVMGWSEGARTAVHVAELGKDKVSKMILLAAGTKVSKLGAMAFAGMKNTDHWLANARAPYLEHYSEDYLRVQWAALCDVVQQVYDYCGGRFPSDLALPKLTLPSLIMTGGQDRFCADPKTCFLNVLKNARAEQHAQGGHDFYMKYPKWFSEKVQAFIKEQSK